MKPDTAPAVRKPILYSDSVGAGEACDLLTFRLGFKCLGKDRSLVALVSAYGSYSSYSVPTPSM
jgi:hypothetical protein